MWRCPNCNEKSEENFNICWNCQTDNPEIAAHKLTSTQPESVGEMFPPIVFQSSAINASPAIAQNPQNDSLAPTFDFFSGLATLLTLFFIGKALFALYADDDYKRILIFICVGIICSALSTIFTIFANRSRTNLTRRVS